MPVILKEDEKRLAVAIHLKEEEKKRELEKNTNNKVKKNKTDFFIVRL